MAQAPGVQQDRRGISVSTVVNKQTFEIKRSVNTSEYSPTDWLINPTIPQAPKRYWEVVGGNLELKNLQDRILADAAHLEEYKLQKMEALEDEFMYALGDRYKPNRREILSLYLALAVATGKTNRAAYIRPLLDWIEAGTVQLFAAQDAVQGANSTEFVDGVGQNINGWLASDPQVSIRTARGLDG